MSRLTLVRLLAALAVMAMLASPVAPYVASQDTTCEEGQVVDEETGDCLDVPAEDDSAEDDSSGEDETDMAAEDESDDLSDDSTSDTTDDFTDDTSMDDGTDETPTTVTNVVLHTFACPEDFDVESVGLADAYFPCQSQPPFPMGYTVTGPAGIILALDGAGDLDAATAYGADLPPGTWTITQDTPGDAWANCLVFDSEGAQIDQIAGAVSGGSRSFELSAGNWLECEWFTNAGGASTTGMPPGEPIGSLTIQGFQCPYGYAPSDSESSLRAGCVEKAAFPSPTYVALVGDVEVARGTHPGDDPSVRMVPLSEAPYPSGTWTIRQILIDDYSGGVLFCSVVGTDGSNVPVEVDGTDGELRIDLLPAEGLTCTGFAIEKAPRSGSAQGLTIVGRLCPAGTLRADASRETCTLRFEDVPAYIDVDVYSPAGVLTEEGGLAPDTTTMTFQSVVSTGTWRLVFTMTGDRPLPEGTCSATLPNGVIQDLRTSTTSDRSAIDIVVGMDHHVTCDLLLFVNEPGDTATFGRTTDSGTTDTTGPDSAEMPDAGTSDSTDPVGDRDDATGETGDDGTSTLTVQVWQCDGNTTASDAYEMLLGSCSIMFGNAPDTSSGLAAGPVTLPKNLGEPDVAYCSVDAADDMLDTFPELLAPDANGRFTIDMPIAATVFCDVFQFPSPDGGA